MTDTNTIQSDALTALHAGAEALHADLVFKLNAAGENVDHNGPEALTVAVAKLAGNTGSNIPGSSVPNYADHALATYQTGMAALLIAFARAHLPAKFQPAAEQAVLAVADVLAGGPANNAQALEHGVEAVVDVAQETFQKPGAQA